MPRRDRSLTISVFLLTYVSLSAVQILLAARYFRRHRRPAAPAPAPITLLQPILSGDPRLAANLLANQTNLPGTSILLLTDRDDPEAARIAKAHTLPNVYPGPGPQDDENPKTAKLARALCLVQTPLLAVLDDDTTLTRPELDHLTAALEHADLATGIPVFTARDTIYECLIAGFVNGNAILTYFPAACLGFQRTINGMVYACRTETLRNLGGFAATNSELTDDYAMARLFTNAGLKVHQAAAFAQVSMTVVTSAHYIRVMRRWFIFANMYLRQNLSPATIFLVALPPLLPLAGCLIAPIPALIAVTARTLANRYLLYRWARHHSTTFDIAAEIAASLLLPLLYITALIRPNHLTWRTRRIQLANGKIRYR